MLILDFKTCKIIICFVDMTLIITKLKNYVYYDSYRISRRSIEDNECIYAYLLGNLDAIISNFCKVQSEC